MFDFALITERTESRVRDDLLGAGPKSVDELHAIAGRLRVKYKVQLDKRIDRAKQEEEHAGGPGTGPQIKDVVGKAAGLAGGIAVGAVGVAGGLMSRFQGGGKEEASKAVAEEQAPSPAAEEAPAAPVDSTIPPAAEEASKDVVVEEVEGDWLGSDKPPAVEPATEPVTDDFAKFSIEDDDEDIM